MMKTKTKTLYSIHIAVLVSVALLRCGAHAQANAQALGADGRTQTTEGRSRTPLRVADSIGEIYTEPGELPRLRVEREGEKLELPLEHTHVNAAITGFVGRVTVTQTYQNPFEHPIEAIYVFPLPENSAVDDMRIKIGEREIIARIKKREQARRAYEQAKQDGHTAALLEQERPNIFTQSVANIEPGKAIEVVVSYLQTLTYDAGQYEFVFPMVVGPRFNPGTPTDRKDSGTGWHPDTDKVPDASRISPPYLGQGVRSGHDISLELVANPGAPIRAWSAPTHQVNAEPTRDGALKLELSEKDSLPNRDFILRYAVDAELPQATLLTHMDPERGGFFTLIVQPPKLDIDKLVGRRELIFVMDVSGSMHGVPLGMGKDAMRQALRQLRPVDTFNVITFAGRTGQAFASPRPANDHNLKAAMDFVDGLKAGGGTQMVKGVETALSPAVESGRHRYVFFMTDGYIGNESEIHAGTERLIAALAERGHKARVFGYGLGSSVNRHLIDGIATHGNGLAVYSSTREDPTGPVKQFFRYIDHAVMTDMEVDWGELEVSDVFPTVKPDLFASRPTVIHGRYSDSSSGSGENSITIRGRANGVEQTMTLSADSSNSPFANPALATLWARSKIADLERSLALGGENTDVVERITQVGLDFRIVTQFTSFVAVDTSKKIDGRATTVLQPLEAPEGVNMQLAAPGSVMLQSNRLRSFGSSAGGQAMQKRRTPSRPLVAPSPSPDETASITPTVEKELRLQIEKELRAAGLPLPSGEVRIRATLSRDGALLQPRLDGADLTEAQRKRIHQVLRRYRVSEWSADSEQAIQLRVFFATRTPQN